MVQTLFFSNIDQVEGVEIYNQRMAEMLGQGYSVVLAIPVEVEQRIAFREFTSDVTKSIMVTFAKPLA